MTKLNFENSRFLDVVNEKDQIVDSRSRTDVHNEGHLHREIHVWMFDQSKNIIFQKRGLHRPSAGLLDATVGGHVNQGEDYLDAAIRETKEETGILIDPANLILLNKFREKDDPRERNLLGSINNFFRNIYIYKIGIKDGQIKKEKSLPGVSFQKLSIDYLTHPTDKKIFGPFILTDEVPLIINYLNGL